MLLLFPDLLDDAFLRPFSGCYARLNSCNFLISTRILYILKITKKLKRSFKFVGIR